QKIDVACCLSTYKDREPGSFQHASVGARFKMNGNSVEGDAGSGVSEMERLGTAVGDRMGAALQQRMDAMMAAMTCQLSSMLQGASVGEGEAGSRAAGEPPHKLPRAHSWGRQAEPGYRASRAADGLKAKRGHRTGR
ncbi:unnamed protein product, partial [Ectocarpus sp. 8 AP-2014]